MPSPMPSLIRTLRPAMVQTRKFAIFCHRWMGLAFCLLFAWWFASGIFMMYWGFPSVTQGDRLNHADGIDLTAIKLSPEEAFAKLGRGGTPAGVQLAMFDGRPIYRFTVGGAGGRGRRGGGSGRGGGAPAGTAAAQANAGGRGTAEAGSRSGFGRGGNAAGAAPMRSGQGRRDGRRNNSGSAAAGPSAAADRAGGAPATGASPAAGRGGGRGGGTPVMVYADDGSVQGAYSTALLLRIAAQWARQPAASARVEAMTATDQWTVQAGLRNLRPLWKYAFPDGQQVYINGRTGEVVQYTTTASRLGAELGPIPHWIYYTPLRVQQKLWTNIIIWASGIGTGMALLGLIVGLSLYSPRKRYRPEGIPTGIPYTGNKRLHMILGLFFGIVTCTWTFSGMLSMDPFPVSTSGASRGPAAAAARDASAAGRIQAVLRAGRFQLSDYEGKPPQTALAQIGNRQVKQLDFTSFDNQPIYMAALSSRETRIIPMQGDPQTEFDPNRIFTMVATAAQPVEVTEQRLLTQYDAYYLDRLRVKPLPVLFVRLGDPQHTQLYIDQRTGRVVAEHSKASSWVTRWLYHGLHSMDFPWLYNHRPAWDIVVLALMLGGLALCITAIIIGWQLLRRKMT